MTSAIIYKPAKNAMQSGKANVKKWLFEYDDVNSSFIEPMMGWTANRDTRKQVKLRFETKEQAIQYAEKHKIEYKVIEPKTSTLKLQAYAKNFM